MKAYASEVAFQGKLLGERYAPTVPNFLSAPSPSPHFVVGMGSSHSCGCGDSLGERRDYRPACGCDKGT